jgi:hypothetical protein
MLSRRGVLERPSEPSVLLRYACPTFPLLDNTLILAAPRHGDFVMRRSRSPWLRLARFRLRFHIPLLDVGLENLMRRCR